MKKKYFAIIITIILILSITFGYALLSANLNINGTSSINNSSWNIHFENIVVSSGSVTASEPVLDTNRTTVTYEVTFNKPGDFYEFTVDAKNDGSIDAMVDLIISKLNNVEITSLPSYLKYEVSNIDGSIIEPKQALYSGTKQTYRVRVEYKKDIQLSDLPQTVQTLNFNFTINYAQADGSEINPNPYYIVVSPQLNTGSVLGSGYEKDYMRTTPEEAMNDWLLDTMGNGNIPFYNIVYVNGRGEIAKNSLGFTIDESLVRLHSNMVLGTYELIASSNPLVFERNVEILKKAYGYSTNPSVCRYRDYTYYQTFNCSVSPIEITLYNNSSYAIAAATKRGGAKFYACSSSIYSSSCNYEYLG